MTYRARHRYSWFLHSPKGKRWDPDNLTHELAKVNRRNGLPWTCGDFRHTFGSHLAQKGESLYKIATLMGNSPSICRRHYAALIPEEMRDVVEFAAGGRVPSPEDGDDTKAMLRRIIDKLDAEELSRMEVPHLRLVKPG